MKLPCLNCLVRVMCNRPCDELLKFNDKRLARKQLINKIILKTVDIFCVFVIIIGFIGLTSITLKEESQINKTENFLK